MMQILGLTTPLPNYYVDDLSDAIYHNPTGVAPLTVADIHQIAADVEGCLTRRMDGIGIDENRRADSHQPSHP